ncbi:uncharacterized protein METZ01_LOCUS21409 [marine metagenome]|uniref:Uncharacterized protein n=1 Tax=marine metagenome TaxID=408172 RepID=A0A381PNG0_9ZZZZ
MYTVDDSLLLIMGKQADSFASGMTWRSEGTAPLCFAQHRVDGQSNIRKVQSRQKVVVHSKYKYVSKIGLNFARFEDQ